jgi:4-hydroxy-tetrahydrodipicolinate synthase
MRKRVPGDMKQELQLEGILSALVTPFTPDSENVDEAALEHLVSRQLEAGAGALVPCGSTGEFAALSNAERRRVGEVVIQAAGGAVPVLPNTGANTTKETIELSQHAQAAGAAGVMVVPPYYESPGWPELIRHFESVATAIDIPIMVYNIPSATGLHLSADQIGELAAIPGVDFLKDSSADFVLLTELIQRFDDKISIFNGWDTLTFAGLAAGAKASVWGAANFIPELAVQLFDATVRRQDLADARKVWAQIWPICDVLEKAPSYVQAVKAACALTGIEVGPPRAPVMPAGPELSQRLAIALEGAGIALAA